MQKGMETSGLLTDEEGRPIKYFHCIRNHRMGKCPTTTDEQKKKAMEAKKAEWQMALEERATQTTNEGGNGAQQQAQVKGQSQLQVEVTDIKGKK